MVFFVKSVFFVVSRLALLRKQAYKEEVLGGATALISEANDSFKGAVPGKACGLF